MPKYLKPNLQDLLDVMLGSRAASTARGYLQAIGKFYGWCKKKKIPLVVPFSVPVVTLYLFELTKKQGKSASCIVQAHAALKWLHSFFPSPGPNPLDSGICANVVESAKRSRSTPIQKKKPLSVSVIKEIINAYGGEDANLKDLRLATLCGLGFSGFLRFNELSCIRPLDLSFEKDHLKIFIRKSKTDIYRKGNVVFIARTFSKYCPVALLERYMKLGGISLSSDLALFRSISSTKRGFVLRPSSLSYSRCRELLKECLKALGYNCKEYGLHSLRSGGASSAVAGDRSISERLLKLHGRWKSDICKDMYILESVNNRLQVSRSLSL